MTEDDLKGAPCWIGADLSQTTDVSAVVLVWHLGAKRFFVRAHGFVCEEGVKRREQTNLPKYRQWAADTSARFTITAGDVADYPRIRRFILEQARTYKVREVIFDAYNAIEMAVELGSEGLTVYRFPQTHKSYTHPCKEWERAIAEGRLGHDGNPVLRWAVQNVALDVDHNGNCKPSRPKSTDKIDMVVAGLMAWSRALESSAEIKPARSVYEGRGIMVVG